MTPTSRPWEPSTPRDDAHRPSYLIRGSGRGGMKTIALVCNPTDRERIIACRNACEGISTEELQLIAAVGRHNAHDGTLYGVDLVAIRSLIFTARSRRLKPESLLRASIDLLDALENDDHTESQIAIRKAKLDRPGGDIAPTATST